MKILVTGAAGFIGSHTAKRFRDKGDLVIAVDNLSRPGARDNLGSLMTAGGMEFEMLDIRNSVDIESLLQRHSDVALIVHAAGQVAVTSSVADPRTDFEINASGTINLLEATRKHAPSAGFFYTSTNKVYGALDGVKVVERDGRYAFESRPLGIGEDQPLDFHSPYGCSKGAADQYVRDYARIYGMKTVVFRQSCIYGTRQFGMEDQGWIAWFVIGTLLGRELTIYGDGKQVRDVLWVDDLVSLYEAAFENLDSIVGNIYNVGGGSFQMSLWDLVRILSEALQQDISPKLSAWRPGDQLIFVSDISKAKNDLGWQPIVSPEQGVAILAKWAQANVALLQRVLR